MSSFSWRCLLFSPRLFRFSCDDYVPNGEETITSTTTTTTTTTTTQPSPSKTTAPTPSTSVTSGPDVTTEPSSTYVTPVFPVGEIYNDILLPSFPCAYPFPPLHFTTSAMKSSPDYLSTSPGSSSQRIALWSVPSIIEAIF